MLSLKDKILQVLSEAFMSRRQISHAVGVTDIYLELTQLVEADKIYRGKEQLTQMEKREKGLPLDKPKFRWVYTRNT